MEIESKAHRFDSRPYYYPRRPRRYVTIVPYMRKVWPNNIILGLMLFVWSFAYRHIEPT